MRAPLYVVTAIVVVSLLSLPAAAQPAISTSVLTDGLSLPVGIANAGDGSERLFVVEQAGMIRIWDGAQLLAQPFADIRSRVLSGGERGLFAVAFHPDFAQNGSVFLSYTRDAVADTDDGDSVVSRFSIDAQDPNRLDTTSESVLLVVEQPLATHNAGDIRFGPDGYLYISIGDGGGGGDPFENAQKRTTLLGKILRIDVDGGTPYAIPASNPFVANAGERGEIWAYGLRNPWKFSFDRSTGDLFIGDVGQGAQEEIDFEPATSTGGLNFGWDDVEGDLCFEPPTGCSTVGLTAPILTYDHAPEGCEAVVGGFRHRGSRSPGLNGWYFFGEGCTRGRLFAASEDAGVWTAQVLEERGGRVTAFGEDEDGELYFVDLSRGELVALPAPGRRPVAAAALGSLFALSQVRSSSRRSG